MNLYNLGKNITVISVCCNKYFICVQSMVADMFTAGGKKKSKQTSWLSILNLFVFLNSRYIQHLHEEEKETKPL